MKGFYLFTVPDMQGGLDRRAALSAECAFLSTHAYAAYDAAAVTSNLVAPAWPVGPAAPWS